MTLLRVSRLGADSKLALPTFLSLGSHFSHSLSIAEVARFDLGKSGVILDMLIGKAVRWITVSSLLWSSKNPSCLPDPVFRSTVVGASPKLPSLPLFQIQTTAQIHNSAVCTRYHQGKVAWSSDLSWEK